MKCLNIEACGEICAVFNVKGILMTRTRAFFNGKFYLEHFRYGVWWLAVCRGCSYWMRWKGVL